MGGLRCRYAFTFVRFLVGTRLVLAPAQITPTIALDTEPAWMVFAVATRDFLVVIAPWPTAL